MTGVYGLSRERFAGWAAIAALCLGIFIVWIEGNFGGDSVTLAVTDLGNLAAALGAAFACTRRAREERGRPRQAWMALGIGCALWAMGVAYVSYFDLWLQRGLPFEERSIPFPSVADVGYLGFVPFALVGVALLPRGVFRHEARARNLLDGLLVALALLAVAWNLLLRDLVAAETGLDVQTVLGIAYPVTDILIAATAACAWTFVPREERGNLLFVVVGLGFLALADFGFFVLVERHLVGISAINALWPAGFACLALGAARPPDAQEATPVRAPLRRDLVTITTLAGLLAVAFNAVSDRMDAVLTSVAILMVLVIVARLLLVRQERRRLREAQARHAGEP